MDETIRSQLTPGARVKVTQQTPFRDHVFTTEVAGEVISFDQRPTGSWFAHARDDKLWLDRLSIKKADGEINILALNAYSHIEVQPPPASPATAPAPPPAT